MAEVTHINRNKRARFGWAMFDWANSVYSLVISTAIFPIYFHAIARVVAHAPEGEDAVVSFMGMNLKSVSLLSLGVSLAYVVISVLTPILGAIADYGGHKKKFMMFFTFLGSGSCAAMYFFNADNFYLGFWLFILAAIGFAGGLIFNDAFLPEVAEKKDYDRLSATGYALGYIGSVLLLVFNLTMVMMPQWYFDVQGAFDEIMAATPSMNMDEAMEAAKASFSGTASRLAFLSVGIWWLGFSMITYLSLKDTKPTYKPKNYLSSGFQELKKVLKQLKGMRNVKRFLFAFFAFDMGIQTVIYMASSYGSEELNMGTPELITAILIIQVIAIGGAFLFAFLSKKFGNFTALLVGILLWTMICFIAYFVTDATGFYIMGALVGLVLGGVQSLARATYTKLLPETQDTASFFSFLAITDKLAIVVGTMAFGLLSQWIGIKPAILFLVVFFALGAYLILKIRKEKPLLA